MIITLIITIILLILIFRFFSKLLRNIFSFFKKKSLERKTRPLEQAILTLAGKLREAERKIELLQKNTVSLTKYRKLENECDLLTKHIKQHIEKTL